MTWYPVRLGGSRAAYALGIGDPQYGTPLQTQRRLLGMLEREAIDETDPQHPAVQGHALEYGILTLSALEWAKRHGHPIEISYTASSAPKTEEDPAGGLRLEHPTEPLECHPDAYFLCRQCGIAWLVDAKRYSSSLDAEAAKDELRTQLAFNLAVSKAVDPNSLSLTLLFGRRSWTLSDTALGAVLRIDAFRQKDDSDEYLTRAVLTPDVLEVPCSPEVQAAVIRTCSEWMRTYVLPWFDGADVPDAPPVTYEDICLLWPRPIPDKVLEQPSAELIALIDEHARLTEAHQNLGATLRLDDPDRSTWLSADEIDTRRKSLRQAILLLTTDHEAVAPRPGSDVVCTLKADQYGNRHIRYAVKSYNQTRRTALKRAAKEKKA